MNLNTGESYFRIELLPALHGDCIWIEYGDADAPKRILIDGGPIGAYRALHARVAKLKPDDREIELFAITHVDADHIEGAVRLIAEMADTLTFREVWFNGWRHLEKVAGLLGPVQGEFVSALIEESPIGNKRWNSTEPFGGGPIVVSEGIPPTATLEGGMQLTLLSPTTEKLEKLRKAWTSDVKHKGFEPGDLDAALDLLRTQRRLIPKGLLGGRYQLAEKHVPLDSAVANGSSLAMVAEYDGRRCLLLGDAHADAVVDSLKRLGATKSNPMRLDAIKVSHHGSRGNTTPELLELVSCKRFLISTNGAIFKHPDRDAIDMIIDTVGPGVAIIFNYFSSTTQAWSSDTDQQKRGYASMYPEEGSGIILEL